MLLPDYSINGSVDGFLSICVSPVTDLSWVYPASCPVTADKGIRTCVNQAAENGWADITLHPFPVLWCKQRVGRYWMEIYINLHKTQSNICATFVQNLDFMTACFLSCANLHFLIWSYFYLTDWSEAFTIGNAHFYGRRTLSSQRRYQCKFWLSFL